MRIILRLRLRQLHIRTMSTSSPHPAQQQAKDKLICMPPVRAPSPSPRILTSTSSNAQLTPSPPVAPAGQNSSAQADQYRKGTLDLHQLSPSPFTQFHDWFRTAQTSGVHQPETVCLSTASLPSGSISSRYVYLKELDSTGFVVYSNWGTSRKAQDVETNPQASLAFWWPEQERQVRVEGPCERLSRAESQVYFSVRARGSKIGAWASQQSSVLKEEEGGREVLERQVKEQEERWEGKADEEIQVPEFWGGLRVKPRMVEFWQGRESRLHDRFRYLLVDGEEKGGEEQEGKWKVERLSP